MVLIIHCPMNAELYGEKCGKILHWVKDWWDAIKETNKTTQNTKAQNQTHTGFLQPKS